MDASGSMWQIVIEGSKVKVLHSTPVQVGVISVVSVGVNQCLLVCLDISEQSYLCYVEE